MDLNVSGNGIGVADSVRDETRKLGPVGGIGILQIDVFCYRFSVDWRLAKRAKTQYWLGADQTGRRTISARTGAVMVFGASIINCNLVIRVFNSRVVDRMYLYTPVIMYLPEQKYG
ncbi:hypothetical protein PG984_002658 [Apiospora sp. TS-2023a]